MLLEKFRKIEIHERMIMGDIREYKGFLEISPQIILIVIYASKC